MRRKWPDAPDNRRMIERAKARLRRWMSAELRSVIGEVPAAATSEHRPPHSVGLSDGRVLCDHPLAPHIILDGHCLLVTPRVLMGRYEGAVSSFLQRVVQAGDIAVDIGANQGFHTLTLGLRVGPTGHVWAFEPHPRTVRFLVDNVASIGLHHIVTVVEAAAWSEEGAMTFRARSGEAAGSYVKGAYSVPDDRVPGDDIEVVTVDIAAFLTDLPRPPKLIKLDAEGSERVILTAAQDLLRRTRPIVVLEFLPAAHLAASEAAEWEQWLRDLGYVIAQLDPNGMPVALPSGGLPDVREPIDIVLQPAP